MCDEEIKFEIHPSGQDLKILNYKYNIEGKMYVWLKIRKDDNKFRKLRTGTGTREISRGKFRAANIRFGKILRVIMT